MTTAVIQEQMSSYEVRQHLCRHYSSDCEKCVRCFHGWHRCHWCWTSRSGLPPEKPKVKFRCAACGRFRPARTIEVCDRCRERRFQPLRLFDVA